MVLSAYKIKIWTTVPYVKWLIKFGIIISQFEIYKILLLRVIGEKRLCIYIYIYIYMCVCVCVCAAIFLHLNILSEA